MIDDEVSQSAKAPLNIADSISMSDIRVFPVDCSADDLSPLRPVVLDIPDKFLEGGKQMGRGRGRRAYQGERRESSPPLRMSYAAMREAEASERTDELWTAGSRSHRAASRTYVRTRGHREKGKRERPHDGMIRC